jgi:hypothetical protein
VAKDIFSSSKIKSNKTNAHIMKPLSDTYKEQGIAFTFPIEIRDAKGNETYYEGSKGYWQRCECDANGTATYFENSDGAKRGIPRSLNTN